MSPLARIVVGLAPWVLSCAASGDDDHAAHAWEWAGAFSLTAGETYTWSAERGPGGEYADADMKMAVVHVEHDHDRRLRRRLSGSADIEEAEVHAEELYDLPDAQVTQLAAGSSFALGEEQMLKLTFATNTWASFFYLTPAETGTYVFFAQHFPVEFENAFHYLRDEHGEDVEPTAEEPDGGSGEVAAVEKNGSLGLAVVAALLTALPGVLMIGVVALMVKGLDFKFWPLVDSFASGAILACAVFLLLAEGLHLAGSGQDEVTGTWTWGTAIMVGWLVGVLSHHLADIIFPKPEETKNPEAADAVQDNRNYMLAVAGPVLFGDFVHNLVDGMVIGFAMKACSSSMTWTIVGVTIAHEAPQEVADFVILVTKAKMPWLWALLANASTAIFSVFIGAVISYEVDVSSNLEGIFLAFGAGVYLFVALTELGSSIVNLSKDRPLMDSLLRLLFFAVGAILIGLCLINHEHCIAAAAGGEEAADPHAGHHHRLL